MSSFKKAKFSKKLCNTKSLCEIYPYLGPGVGEKSPKNYHVLFEIPNKIIKLVILDADKFE